MKKNEIRPDAFYRAMELASEALRKQDIQGSRLEIVEAMALDMDAPQPHNLLGILCEIAGDDDKARKHYRAAYALDPEYKPACRNLERLVMGDWTPRRDYDFGMEPQAEKKPAVKNGAFGVSEKP